MLEGTFRDLEHVRIIDWLLDLPEGEFDAERVSKETKIPYMKARWVMDHCAEIGVIKLKNKKIPCFYVVDEKSPVYKALDLLNLELSGVIAKKKYESLVKVKS